MNSHGRPASGEEYEAIIIGAGQAGAPLATTLAGAGWRTALVERAYIGGTCINYGCTPTKTMVASARAAHVARQARTLGVDVGSVRVDLAAVRRRKQTIVESFRDGSRARLETTPNLDLVFGEASFSGPRAVHVRLKDGGTRSLSGKRVILNTGERPVVPRIPGIESVAVLDSTSIMELDELPEHLVVLGGGYIGVEFGQMFRRFGSRITLVQQAAQLLGREDPDVAAEVTTILREDGIDVLLESNTTGVRPSRGGGIELAVKTARGEITVAGSHLLAAVGRTPGTERLNLAAAGVETDARGYVKTNERLETTAPGIYALGDMKGGPAFTHISYDDSRVLERNLLGDGKGTTAGRLVPYTVFMDPQLGRIGITETEARAGGKRIRVARLPMESVPRAIELGETRGFMKAVIDADSGRILGCSILGMEGGELMAMIEIAMLGGLPYTTLRDGIFAHPTLAECWNILFYSFDEE